MRLKKILKSIKIIDSNVDFEAEIENITSDSRKISNGSLFVAIKGTKRDGNLYIYEALNNGAKAIVTENNDYCIKEIPYILVESARGALSLMLSELYGNPTIGKKVIAITGTNGKTSTAYFIYSIFIYQSQTNFKTFFNFLVTFSIFLIFTTASKMKNRHFWKRLEVLLLNCYM